MTGKSKYLVKRNNSLIDNYQSIIALLYMPIISNDGVSLYFLLNSCVDCIAYDIERLCVLTTLDINSLEQAFKKLEQYGLVNSLYNQKDDCYLFVVNNPLTAQEFFNHQIYSRVYLKAVGDQQYQLSQAYYASSDVDMSEYVDITKKIDLSVLNSWDQCQENKYQSMADGLIEEYIDFDYQTFLQDLSPLILPVSLRNKENLDIIGKLASDYAISAQRMKALVGKSVDIKTNTINFDTLKTRCINEKSVDVKEVNDPYQDNPIAFLYRKQLVPVAAADKRLIEYLTNTLKMKREVINYLIEQTLENTNGKFNRDYVEKVATTWCRQNIDSLQKAKEQYKTITTNKEQYLAKEMEVTKQDIKALREKMFRG